jgi:hypothetical protein
VVSVRVTLFRIRTFRDAGVGFARQNENTLVLPTVHVMNMFSSLVSRISVDQRIFRLDRSPHARTPHRIALA